MPPDAGPATDDERATPRLVVDRYVLESVLGRGGAGTVWRARDTVLDRVVAVKEVVVPPAAADRSDLRARVLREARAAARLTHPNVVQIYDVAVDHERIHLVMELVPAPSLDALVRRNGPVAPAAAAALGLDVLAALEAAAREGIVHRDVKPGNVIVADRGAKLADFGIASLLDDPSITASGTVLGSPAYMAPEQARGEPSGAAADLWALGATLYYAVEGVGPFDRDAGPLPTLTAVVLEPPRPAARAGALAPLLTALLDKDPSRRPSGQALHEALREVADGSVGGDRADTVAAAWGSTSEAAPAEGFEPGPSTRSPADAGPAARGPRAGRQRLAVAAVIIALAIAGAAALLLPDDAGAPDAAAPAPADPADDPADTTAADDTAADTNAADGVTGDGAADDDAPAEGEQAAQDTEPEDAPAPAEPPDDETGEDDDGGGGGDAAVPADWLLYTDPDTGYEIAHPPTWEVVQVSDTLTDFRDPSSPRYLRVDWADEPVRPATAPWETMSASFAATKADYEEVRLDATTYQGHDAAEWEYRYTEGGARLHGINLGIGAPDNGYALNFVTIDEDWDAAQPQFEAFKAAFVIPG